MFKRLKKSGLSVLLISGLLNLASGQISLPKLISDGMVLQRDAAVKIWGWAGAGESVRIDFIGNTYETIANDSGSWEITISALKAGGPHTMTIRGSNSITINDILIGDVWVCSGQSNMELNMNRASPLYGKEIENSLNSSIRYFSAPQTYNFHAPVMDYGSGSWKAANPETVLTFGAIAYFFARELNEKYKVPIGIINTAIGGTPIEAWISEEAIRNFPGQYMEAQRFKNDSLIRQIELKDRQKTQEWYAKLAKLDKGYQDSGKKWKDPDYDASGWNTMDVPGYWATKETGPNNGIMWFRRTFDINPSQSGQPGKLLMGRIVDADSVFINGSFIGTVSYQYPPRRYNVPAGLLVQGKNTIVVKVINNGGFGGFVPDKPYELSVGGQKIDLKGTWFYRQGAKIEPLTGQTTIKYKPTGLFNAMISPILSYRIKGVLWYQGESNAERPTEYRQLFPALINDWRGHWKQGDFPFLFVQLPNFMEAKPEPSESNWALFRESQQKTLSIANTGMAVAIDIGEWNDIHPLNKLDVAKRLALVAQKVAYGDDNVVYSGPVYQSIKISGNKAVLTFSNTGTGLMAKGGSELNQFAIAGADKKFVWANAVIKKNKVVVWNKSVPHPVSVRYAWADNPKGSNLFNKEGLPASPFRTDE